MELQGWILMSHHTWIDYNQARGSLVGQFYADIESVCRALRDDAFKYEVINVTPREDGQAVLIECSEGEMFGAWLCVLEQRKQTITEHQITWRK